MSTRIVFMGSPEFALPTLQALADHYAVAGVVTQPDRPAGRGRNLTPPPVKILAEERGLQVIQPIGLRDSQAIAQLRAWEPDLVVVTAFGQILRPEVLDLPPLGCINVHASLLPRWRGAAPIQAALLQGDQQTGVTIMKMNPGIDTGPILSQRAITIHSEETGGSLAPKLAQLGAELLIDTLPSYLSGDLQPQAQHGEASYAPMLKKSDGQLDFTQTAKELECKVRAFNPWPGAFLDWQGGRLKIHRARVVDNIKRDAMVSSEPGRQIVYEDYPAVITVKGSLVLVEVQPAGKKPMSGEVFLRGAREWVT
jgi:methionyl-tRNA formyltransferase